MFRIALGCRRPCHHPLLSLDDFHATMSQPPPQVVPLEGEIDLNVSPQILARLNPFIAQRVPQLHVNLQNVSYIDSSGLATFIDAMQRVQAYGGEFALVALRDNVRKIFEIARLDQVFKILPAPAAGA